MPQMKNILLQVLYNQQEVRASYVQLLRSLIEMEYTRADSYEFYDGERQRCGIAYKIGQDEAFWLRPTDNHPEQLVIPSPTLRENLLDLLACHPLYAKWFG